MNSHPEMALKRDRLSYLPWATYLELPTLCHRLGLVSSLGGTVQQFVISSSFNAPVFIASFYVTSVRCVLGVYSSSQLGLVWVFTVYTLPVFLKFVHSTFFDRQSIHWVNKQIMSELRANLFCSRFVHVSFLGFSGVNTLHMQISMMYKRAPPFRFVFILLTTTTCTSNPDNSGEYRWMQILVWYLGRWQFKITRRKLDTYMSKVVLVA